MSKSVDADISEVDWNGTVALAYTAEQIFAAAQLLTSNTISPQHPVALACREAHLGSARISGVPARSYCAKTQSGTPDLSRFREQACWRATRSAACK
jgi:hypothetical protein